MYTFDSRIRYSEADSEGALSFLGMLNYFQDCSTFQSEDLGVGVRELHRRHMVWVLSSWQIDVERYPLLGERVKIGTLPYEFKRFLGFRNFAMLGEDGEWLARANSLWALLGTDTQKPVDPPAEVVEKYVLEERLLMDYAPRRIAVGADGGNREPITVRRHHLDINRHVNNGQYVEIAMDFLPEHFPIRRLRAEYKMQAFLDDVLYPYVVEKDDTYVVSLNDAEGKAYFIAEFTRMRRG